MVHVSGGHRDGDLGDWGLRTWEQSWGSEDGDAAEEVWGLAVLGCGWQGRGQRRLGAAETNCP